MADRVASGAKGNLDAQVTQVFRDAFQREPDADSCAWPSVWPRSTASPRFAGLCLTAMNLSSSTDMNDLGTLNRREFFNWGIRGIGATAFCEPAGA